MTDIHCSIYVKVPRSLLDELECEIDFSGHITSDPAINIAKALRIMNVLKCVNEHAEDELSKQLSELKDVYNPIEIRVDPRQIALSTKAMLVQTRLVEVAEEKYKQLFSN